MHEFEFKEIEEATETFSQTRLIGKGSHGNVYKGILKDSQLIAVKKQSLGLSKLKDNSKLQSEAKILSLISNFKNPHLINLMGITHDDSCKNKVILVMEFMPNGTLEDLLHGNNSVIVGWDKRLEIVMQIAKGVMFLHEGKGDCVIVHRDIKSANVLFDWEWNARLCDFGLSVKMDDEDFHERNRPAGTIGYLDPCYTVPGKLSTKIDVFSFGVLLLEIISGRKAMDFSKSPSSIVDWAIPLIRTNQISEVRDKRIPLPRFMEGVISSTLRLASRCLLPREENRPSMKEIVVELQNCRTYVEPVMVRLPAWMNLLPYCCWFHLSKDKSAPDATGFCYGDEMNDDPDGRVDDISKRKMMLWEILADFS